MQDNQEQFKSNLYEQNEFNNSESRCFRDQATQVTRGKPKRSCISDEIKLCIAMVHAGGRNYPGRLGGLIGILLILLNPE